MGALMSLSEAICQELAHTHHEKLIALKERSWLNLGASAGGPNRRGCSSRDGSLGSNSSDDASRGGSGPTRATPQTPRGVSRDASCQRHDSSDHESRRIGPDSCDSSDSSGVSQGGNTQCGPYGVKQRT